MFTELRNLGYSIVDLFGFNQAPIPEPSEGNQLLQGSTLRTATAFGRTATVKAGEDIRPALNSLKSAGGGTLILLEGTHRPTYDIVGDSKINIIGVGVDQTIIDFGSGAYSLQIIGTEGSEKSNFSIKNLTVQNSTDTHAIWIEWSQNFTIENIKSDSNSSGCDGLYIENSTDWILENSVLTNNAGKGLSLYGSGEFTGVFRFVVRNTRADDNTGSGFYSDHELGGGNARGSFINCVADDNGDSGFELEVTSSAFLMCEGIRSTNHSFEVKGSKNIFVGCLGLLGGDDNFEVTGDDNKFIGCTIDPNTTGYNISGTGNVVLGSSGGKTSVGTLDTTFEYTDADVFVDFNQGQTAIKRKNLIRARNTSGSTLANGDVVIFKKVASGYEVSTTTTQGDNLVYGMATESIVNNSWGDILVDGYTTALKVNGTDDIAVGDYLASYSSAGIAAKARVGDQVFAVALEAYSTDDSSGVIDALILPNRFPLLANSDIIPNLVECLHTNTTSVGNVGTGVDDLMSYSIPADSLETNGETIRVTAWGLGANNGNAKTVQLLFGAALVASVILPTSTSARWKIEAYISKTGTGTQDWVVHTVNDQSSTQVDIDTGTATEDETGTITVKCTGEGTADDDVEQYFMSVELLHQ